MTKFQKENILISVAGKERKSPQPRRGAMQNTLTGIKK